MKNALIAALVAALVAAGMAGAATIPTWAAKQQRQIDALRHDVRDYQRTVEQVQKQADQLVPFRSCLAGFLTADGFGTTPRYGRECLLASGVIYEDGDLAEPDESLYWLLGPPATNARRAATLDSDPAEALLEMEARVDELEGRMACYDEVNAYRFVRMGGERVMVRAPEKPGRGTVWLTKVDRRCVQFADGSMAGRVRS